MECGLSLLVGVGMGLLFTPSTNPGGQREAAIACAESAPALISFYSWLLVALSG